MNPHERCGKKLAAAAAAVKVNVKEIVRVELDFKPGTAIGDDAEGMKHLPVEVLGTFKANTRRTVQLGDDDAFRAVDNECAAIGHHGNFSHVNGFRLGFIFGFQTEIDL